MVDQLNGFCESFALRDDFAGTNPLETKPLDVAAYYRGVLGEEKIVIVLDQKDVDKCGLLMLNTSYYGFPDALRHFVNEDTASAAASYDCMHTEWWEAREMSLEGDNPLQPYRRYAVYNSALGFGDITKESIQVEPTATLQQTHPDFYALIRTLNNGLGGLSYPEPDGHRPAEWRDIYVAITAPSMSLDKIKLAHAGIASENNLDQEYFIFIDQDWEKAGLLFVKLLPNDIQKDLQGQHDEFRDPSTSVQVGELLNWIFHGLMTWEEAKAVVPVDRKEQQKIEDEKYENS